MTQLCTHLQDLSLDAAALYGSKAAVLGVLLHSGLPVPKGMALSSQIYNVFLEHNQFPYECCQYVSHNDEIRQFLLHGSFPAEVLTILRDVYQLLTENGRTHRLAVRSSALCEDRHTHSLAGVFESYVNLETYEAFEAAIKKCYASMFSDQAMVFMLKQTMALDALNMGVIVQQFVPGAPSGVMFSADTITMNPDVLVINAVDGPCSGYVDGTLPSTLYKVHKHTGAVIETHAAASETRLSADAIAQLRAAAVRIEQIVGNYQDIEWTFSNGELCILQARPITTFTPRTQEFVWPDLSADGKTWRRDDNVPNPLLPLQQEITMQVYQGNHVGLLVTGKGRGFEGRIVNGYAYHIPNFKRSPKRTAAFAAKVETLCAAGNNIFTDDVLPQILTYTDRLGEYLQRPLSGADMADFLETAIEYHGRGWEFHFIATDRPSYLATFEAYCREKCPALTTQDVYDLVYQVSWFTKDREAVLRMARHVNSHAVLQQLFQTQPSNELLFASLGRSPEGRELLRQIQDYLKDFGLFPQAMVVQHAQIAPPVLLENPAAVITKIRGCLNVDSEVFFRSQKATFVNKPIVLQMLLAALPEAEQQEFRVKLNAAEKAFLAEDNHSYYLDLRMEGYSRIAIVKTGERLATDGVIAAAGDIYFLTLDEIKQVLTTGLDNVRQLINERRALHQQQKLLTPPDTLGKAPEPPQPKGNHQQTGMSVAGAAEHPQRLTGVSGCRKNVRGTVKLFAPGFQTTGITEPCILVMQHGHWNYLLPLLGNIRGLIFDEGSPFDHPGIIARELEIPAIYQTKQATKILHDGDEVEIDSVHGQVIVYR